METIYLTITMSLLLLGLAFISKGFLKKKTVRFKAKPGKRIRETIMAMGDKSSDEVFQNAGINLSVARYTAIRNLSAILAISYIVVEMLLAGIPAVKMQLILAMALYFVTAPKEYGGKKKTPTLFKKALDVIKKGYQDKKDEELMNLVSQLKNMIVTQKDNPKSADYILETLMRFSNITAPVFMSALSLVRRGRPDEAYRDFAKKFDTKLGSDFAAIIGKLDQMNPAELVIQIDAFQSGIKEERRTRRLRKQEANGHRVFALASVLIVLLMFDFMYILFSYLMLKMEF